MRQRRDLHVAKKVEQHRAKQTRRVRLDQRAHARGGRLGRALGGARRLQIGARRAHVGHDECAGVDIGTAAHAIRGRTVVGGRCGGRDRSGDSAMQLVLHAEFEQVEERLALPSHDLRVRSMRKDDEISWDKQSNTCDQRIAFIKKHE